MSAELSVETRCQKPSIEGAGLFSAVAATAASSFDRLLAGMVRAGQGLEAICLFLSLTRSALFEHVVRLGLPTPPDKKFRRPGPKAWSVLDTTRLIVWRLAGVHPETIGVRLGRSANAVRAKARRLGVPAPPRRELRRVDPASLVDPGSNPWAHGAGSAPEPSSASAVDRCGRAAGAVSIRGGADWPSAPAPTQQPSAAPTPQSSTRPARADRAHGLERPAGQRVLPLFQVVPAPARHEPPAATIAPVSTITPPRTEAEVDLSGDLRWIGQLRKPLHNRAMVWTLGMLYFGGLHWKAIPARIGKTPAAVRTLQSMCWLPRDRDRRKFTDRFDEADARATLAESGYEVACDITSREYFWRHKSDRGAVRQNRKHRRALGLVEKYTSQEITLITARDLAERRARSSPFASPGAMLTA